MKTWMDALGTCTAAGGSVGGWPPPDSGASPDIPCPLRSCFLPTGCAGGIGPATCGLSPAFCNSALFSRSGVSGMAAYRQTFQQAVLRLLAPGQCGAIPDLPRWP